MRRLGPLLLLSGAVLFALTGLVAFVLLFVRGMNVYWFILSPLILAVYQMPAVVLFWLWKRGKKRAAAESAESEPAEDSGNQDD
jgi:Na+-transporting methylmalonyl-CoA/oxaloacetate decarboxylase gamma subunit